MNDLITCYRCNGDGMIYKYELKLGPNKKCPGCQGKTSLQSSSCIKCIKCKGTGQIYEYDEDIGQKIECPLCKNKGYTSEKYLECLKCKGSGKIYPFQLEKLGVPKKCNVCQCTGYVKEKEYNKINMNMNANNNNGNTANNQNYNFLDKIDIRSTTQGYINPMENKNMVWQNIKDGEYNSEGNSIYNFNDRDFYNNSNNNYNNNYFQQNPNNNNYSNYQGINGYNNNYNNNYNYNNYNY